MSRSREDNSESVRAYFRSLRPWVVVLVVMIYVVASARGYRV